MKTSWLLYSFIIEIKNECGWDTIVLSWYLLQIDLFFKPFINHTFSISTIDSIQPATLVEAFFVISISDFFYMKCCRDQDQCKAVHEYLWSNNADAKFYTEDHIVESMLHLKDK